MEGADGRHVRVQPLEQIADDVRQYQAIGIDDFILSLARGSEPPAVMAAMERFALEVIPLVSHG